MTQTTDQVETEPPFGPTIEDDDLPAGVADQIDGVLADLDEAERRTLPQ